MTVMLTSAIVAKLMKTTALKAKLRRTHSG